MQQRRASAQLPYSCPGNSGLGVESAAGQLYSLLRAYLLHGPLPPTRRQHVVPEWANQTGKRCMPLWWAWGHTTDNCRL